MILKDLECDKCGRIFTIQRKDSRNKAAGHIKHLWCITCGKRTPHVEMGEFNEPNRMKSMKVGEKY